MNHRKKIHRNIYLSLIALAISIVLLEPTTFGLCPLEYKYCFEPYDDNIGQPVSVFALVLLIISLLLLFVREQKFNSWLRFAKYYLPIAAAIIFLSPGIDSTIGGFDKEFMTWLLAGIFFVVSLGIIIFSSRKRQNTLGARLK